MTHQEAKKAGLIAMTVDDRPGTKIQTAYGERLWLDWCQREVQRLRGVGRQAEIVTSTKGCAVWVSPPAPPAPFQVASG